MKLTSKDVLELLRQKHAEDVFVPECKTGPSWGGQHFRMDAWAMNKSWANARVTAYEVKVSRSDFLQDNKWQAYLGCCNELYFVCPAGLIKPEELSPQVGLMYVASTGSRLFTKKKAQFRETEIPDQVWRYIVMCRTKIVSEEQFTPQSKTEYWKQWLAEKESRKNLGYSVAKSIHEYCEKIERENESLIQKMKDYDDIRQVLQQLGWSDPDKEQWLSSNRVKNKVEELRGKIPPYLSRLLSDVERSVKTLHQELEQIESGNPANTSTRF